MAREVATRGRGEVATTTDTVEGLEDVSAGDLILPIMKINHTEGVFVDSLSNETFEEFDAIILGLVKGRILWPSEVGDEGEQPICRSLDFRHGRPHPVKFLTKDVSGEVPYKVARFSKDKVETAAAAAEEGINGDLDDLLLCASCNLKEWETMPGAKTPWCSEQYTFPIIRVTEEGGHAPAYITFQRASLKACRAYISAFKQSNKPMYTVVTRIRAIHQKRGNVQFVTPEFTKGQATDPETWADYSLALSEIRSFLTTPRTRQDDSTSDDDDNGDQDETPTKSKSAKSKEVIDTTATDPDEDDDDTPPPSTKGKKPAPAPEPDDEDDEDEEPF